MPCKTGRCRDCVVHALTRVWIGRSGVCFPAEERDFSLLHIVQNSCEAHQASCSLGVCDTFPGVKVTWK